MRLLWRFQSVNPFADLTNLNASRKPWDGKFLHMPLGSTLVRFVPTFQTSTCLSAERDTIFNLLDYIAMAMFSAASASRPGAGWTTGWKKLLPCSPSKSYPFRF